MNLPSLPPHLGSLSIEGPVARWRPAPLTLDAATARDLNGWLQALSTAEHAPALLVELGDAPPPVTLAGDRTPASQLDALLAWHQLCRAFETSGLRIGAFLDGPADNGLADLCLCLPHLWLTDRACLGWPGMTAGHWSALGATQRLPRLLGLAPALSHLLGQPLPAADLVSAGLAHTAADAQTAADALALAEPGADRFDPRRGARVKPPVPSPTAQQILLGAQAQVARRLPTGHVAERVLVAVAEGAPLALDRALEVEARVFVAWLARLQS